MTAMALVPLLLWFVAWVVALAGADRAAMVGWLSAPWNATLMILLIGATFHHAQLGLQVVIEDYVHQEGLRIALILVVKGLSWLLAIAATLAVLATLLSTVARPHLLPLLPEHERIGGSRAQRDLLEQLAVVAQRRSSVASGWTPRPGRALPPGLGAD
jgi:succinate dehydrogenase / fumarate reductase membrane anchor subunit